MLLTHAWAELDVARFKAEFYRMWYAGYHAGLDYPTTLGSMHEFTRSPSVEKLRGYLLAGTKRRAALASLTKARPRLFVPFEAALLVLGEESGSLETCLKLLADFFAAEHRMILWIKKKLSYPMFQALAATFIAPFPLLFFGHPAQYVLAVAGGLTLCATAGGSLLLGAAKWYGQRPKFVRGRLARALVLGVEAGLPLGRVVELAVDAAASPEISAHLARQQPLAVGSQPLAKTFAGCDLIPREMLATMEIADASGNYSETLKRLADLYDGGYS
jgi:type II secretory pathway component PulF